MDYKTPLNSAWLFKMAWRDSRRNRSRLLLFISSIVLGIAALVAIYSFGNNLKSDIDNQAATLLGADLVLSTNKPVEKTDQRLVDSLGNERSGERIFASMILFPKNKGTRLVQIHALEGGFPYYGELETEPALAGKEFRNGAYALVDKTLMLQFQVKVGDSIKVGNITFAIAGALNKAPGQNGFAASIAPSVYIPLSYLEKTGLSQKGSRISYKFYYKFNDPASVDKLVEKLEPRLEKAEFNYDTIKSQKEQTGRSFEDLTRFLALVGFIALLLGCIGVASAIHIYIREKISTIAVLRCLGVKARQAFLIYLIQIAAIGLLGSLLGAALGTLIQQALPAVLKDFLPIEISVAISWPAIGQGILLGLIISVLFALLPLVSIRKISPLNTLRMSYESDQKSDPLAWLVYALILLFVFGFTWMQVQRLQQAIIFTLSIIVAFLILTGTAKLVMWLVRKFFPASWNYLWRQGFSNLYRPNNQTTILILSLGLGTAFICTLFFIQGILVGRVSMATSANQPNMILFDIQTSQKEQVAALVRKYKLPIAQQVPIVTMQLTEINGITAGEAKKDSNSKYSPGTFRREYRVTYRDTLTNTETISKGEWSGTANYPRDTPRVSLEEGLIKRSKIRLGDKLMFNVQGVPVPAIVGSIRKVEWNRVQTNFLIVFPKGVIEDAPQFHVLVTRAGSENASAEFQQAVVMKFPNISVIDLGLILTVLDEILDKIGFVIRFMAGFSIITGIVVLIASVMISKYQRMQESVLLRTIGASRKQILAITALEYFFLGAISAFTGIFLSMAASWGLAHYMFETKFNPQLLPVLIIFISVSLLTVVIGLVNSRSVVSRPPLEILRKEI